MASVLYSMQLYSTLGVVCRSSPLRSFLSYCRLASTQLSTRHTLGVKAERISTWTPIVLLPKRNGYRRPCHPPPCISQGPRPEGGVYWTWLGMCGASPTPVRQSVPEQSPFWRTWVYKYVNQLKRGLFFPFFFFCGGVSLCTSGWPRTFYIDQVSLELKGLPAYASQVLGWKAYATVPGCFDLFLDRVVYIQVTSL